MAVQLFLSCVSDEFGGCRDALRGALTRPNVDVKIQEDFKALGGDTLMILEAYVKHCEAVVHFAGDMTGSAPPDFCVQELLARRPDLRVRLPLLGAAIEAGKSISYTQWEAWLAIYHGKALVIAAPEPGVARDPKFAPTAHSKAAQADHLKRLREIDRHPEVKFANADNLVARIFASAVIDALAKAAASPTRQAAQPSLRLVGPSVLGPRQALDHLRAALLANKNAAVAAIALHGLGGVGKRRLAVEYAWRREADYSALLFLRADNPDIEREPRWARRRRSTQSAGERGAGGRTKIDAALGWLENHPTWLMILDNVGDEEGIAAVSEADGAAERPGT